MYIWEQIGVDAGKMSQNRKNLKIMKNHQPNDPVSPVWFHLANVLLILM